MPKLQSEQNLIGEMIQHGLGITRSDLQRFGRQMYPQEDPALNHGPHRLASRISTAKYGPLVAQLLGFGIEGAETVGKLNRGDDAPIFSARDGSGMFDATDIVANNRGIVESVMKDNPNNPFGLARMLGQGEKVDALSNAITELMRTGRFR